RARPGVRRYLDSAWQARKSAVEHRQIRLGTVLQRAWLLSDAVCRKHRHLGRWQRPRLIVVACGELFLPVGRGAFTESRGAKLDDQARADQVQGPNDGRLVYGKRTGQSRGGTRGRKRRSGEAAPD